MLTGRYSTLWGGCVGERVSAVIVCSSRGMVLTNLCPDESLKAGLEVVDAAVVELGHLIQQLLVFSLKVFPDWSELLSGLRCEKKREESKEQATSGQYSVLTSETRGHVSVWLRGHYRQMILPQVKRLKTDGNKDKQVSCEQIHLWGIISVLLLIVQKDICLIPTKKQCKKRL